jgi:hypothetical protein
LTDSGAFMLVAAQVHLGLYGGEAQRTWNETSARRAQLRRSWFARLSFEPTAEALWCGLAAEVALSTSGRMRDEMLRETTHSAARARQPLRLKPTVACAHGDRKAAIRALRALIARPKTGPLFANAARRRLGELLGGDEGAGLISEADTSLRAGGVEDPARYVRVLLPGVQLA